MVIFPQPCLKASMFYSEIFCNFLMLRSSSKQKFKKNNDNNKFNKKKIHSHTENSYDDLCLDSFLMNLFFVDDDFKILDKIIEKSTLHQNLEKHKEEIKLKEFDTKSESYYNGPRCLDGSPDMRYKGGYSMRYETLYSVIKGKTIIKEKLHKSISKDRICKSIERYNFYVFALKDDEFLKLYSNFLDINSECNEKKNDFIVLSNEYKYNITLHGKLIKHKEIFSEEQQQQFSMLELKIDDIKNKIENFNKTKYTQEFKQLEEQLINKFNNLKKKKIDVDVLNEIDNAFGEIHKVEENEEYVFNSDEIHKNTKDIKAEKIL